MTETKVVIVAVFVVLVGILAVSSMTLSIIENHNQNKPSNTTNGETKEILEKLNVNNLNVQNFKSIDENSNILYTISQKAGKKGDVLELSEDSITTNWKSASKNNIERGSTSVKNSVAVFNDISGESFLPDSGVSVEDGEMKLKSINVMNSSDNSLLFKMPTTKGLKNQVVKKAEGTNAIWATATGESEGGDVTGPPSSIENKDSLCLFDHETGKRIKSSKVYCQGVNDDTILSIPEINTEKLSIIDAYTFPIDKPNNGDIVISDATAGNQLLFSEQAKGNVFFLEPPLNANVPVSTENSRQFRSTNIIATGKVVQAAGISSNSETEPLFIAINPDSSSKGELELGGPDSPKVPMTINARTISYNFSTTQSAGTSSNPIVIENAPVFLSNLDVEKAYIKPPDFILTEGKSQVIDIVNASVITELTIEKKWMYNKDADVIIAPCSTVKITSFLNTSAGSSEWLVNRYSSKIPSFVLNYPDLNFSVNEEKAVLPLLNSHEAIITSYSAFPAINFTATGYKLNAQTGAISYDPTQEYQAVVKTTILAMTNKGYAFSKEVTITTMDNLPDFVYNNTATEFDMRGKKLSFNFSDPIQRTESLPAPKSMTWSIDYGSAGFITYYNLSASTGRQTYYQDEDGTIGFDDIFPITVTNGSGNRQIIQMRIFSLNK